MTTDNGAAVTPSASLLAEIPRSRNEKSSASTCTPARAALPSRLEQFPGRAGKTPFCTRNRVTSLPSFTRFAAKSYCRATTLFSNGSRDSIKRYFAIPASVKNRTVNGASGCSSGPVSILYIGAILRGNTRGITGPVAGNCCGYSSWLDKLLCRLLPPTVPYPGGQFGKTSGDGHRARERRPRGSGDPAAFV